MLHWPAKHLYDDISDFKKKGEYKTALGSLQEQSVKDATTKAKETYLIDGTKEQYSLIKAKAARGFSIAKFNKKGWMDHSSLYKVVKDQRKKLDNL